MAEIKEITVKLGIAGWLTSLPVLVLLWASPKPLKKFLIGLGCKVEVVRRA